MSAEFSNLKYVHVSGSSSVVLLYPDNIMFKIIGS